MWNEPIKKNISLCAVPILLTLEKLKVTNAEATNKHKRDNVLKEKDMIMMYILKERFFISTYNKLNPNKYGPYNS